MRLRRPAVLLATILLAAPALAAMSQNVPPSASKPLQPPGGGEEVEFERPPELRALFPEKANTPACYSRTYDAKHLAAHPDQKVTAMELRLVLRTIGSADDSAQGHLFQMRVKTRGSKETMTGIGPCMVEGGKVFCGIECDGGGVFVKKREDGALLVSFDDMWGIRLADDCGEGEEEDSASLTPGKDDKAFRLDLVASCPAYEQW